MGSVSRPLDCRDFPFLTITTFARSFCFVQSYLVETRRTVDLGEGRPTYRNIWEKTDNQNLDSSGPWSMWLAGSDLRTTEWGLAASRRRAAREMDVEAVQLKLRLSGGCYLGVQGSILDDL